MRLVENSSLFVCPNYHKSLMIPRSQMPQINSEDDEHFCKHVEEKTGKTVLSQVVYPGTLNPSQGEFDLDKVDNMGSTKSPIYVSSDNYVLDGHHRWLANHKNGAEQRITKLPLDHKMAVKLMNEYTKSFQKPLEEDVYEVAKRILIGESCKKKKDLAEEGGGAAGAGGGGDGGGAVAAGGDASAGDTTPTTSYTNGSLTPGVVVVKRRKRKDETNLLRREIVDLLNGKQK